MLIAEAPAPVSSGLCIHFSCSDIIPRDAHFTSARDESKYLDCFSWETERPDVFYWPEFHLVFIIINNIRLQMDLWIYLFMNFYIYWQRKDAEMLQVVSK